MTRSSIAKPGAALRVFRRDNRWTLAEVSQKTGLPISTLSRIENDQISPTYDQLSKLSEGLGIDMARLLSSIAVVSRAGQTGRRSVNRQGEGQVLDTSAQKLTYLCADLVNKQFAPIIGEIKARSVDEAGSFESHDGEEFIFVIEGEFQLHSESYSPLRLKTGDSVYFDSSMPHAYVSIGDGPCRVLSICTAPHPEEANARPPGAGHEDDKQPAPPMAKNVKLVRT